MPLPACIYIQKRRTFPIGPVHLTSKVARIKQFELCLEIPLPTNPLTNIDDPDGEIALCTLSALN